MIKFFTSSPKHRQILALAALNLSGWNTLKPTAICWWLMPLNLASSWEISCQSKVAYNPTAPFYYKLQVANQVAMNYGVCEGEWKSVLKVKYFSYSFKRNLITQIKGEMLTGSPRNGWCLTRGQTGCHLLCLPTRGVGTSALCRKAIQSKHRKKLEGK